MAIPADFRPRSVSLRANPMVVCAACGTQFDADGATTGARVRCPLCAEVVELANVIAQKRHYRARTITRATPRRVSAMALRGIAASVAIALVATALWYWREAVWGFVHFVYTASRDLVRPRK